VRSDTPERPAPHLRLVQNLTGGDAHWADQAEHAPSAGGSAQVDRTPHVLIAGADAAIRTRMYEELCDLLPPGTHFAQVSETWEVIAGACTSSMVVLAGDLGDVSSASVMRLLGRRYPTLPVLAIAEQTPTHTAADVDVAHA
jgi:hypothetical protein